MAKVSVIIPTYQTGRFIAQAIDSVLNQTFPVSEIIVVDDGSTDQTESILRGYGDRIQVIRQMNQGPSAARNTGIRAAQGEFVAFLDADDYWSPDKLQKECSVIQSDPQLGLVFCDCVFFDNQGQWKKTSFQMAKPAKGWVYQDLFIQNFIPTIAVVARRICLAEIGWFDETFRCAEDYDYWIRLSKKWKIDYVEEPLTYYRIHENQTSGNSRQLWTSVVKIKNREISETPSLNHLRQEILDQFYFNLMIRCAKAYLLEGYRSEAQAILSNYRVKRGFTLRYGLYWLVSCVPNGFSKKILMWWDRVYHRGDRLYQHKVMHTQGKQQNA